MEKIDEAQWYGITGNGFPPPLYSVFKVMWLRDQEPEMFRNIDKVIGSKDFINYRLTGRIATDYSYASGSGVYNLTGWIYSEDLIEASGLQREIFPEIVPSTEVLGHLTEEASRAMGLSTTVKVVAGGVDNSCMALGARSKLTMISDEGKHIAAICHGPIPLAAADLVQGKSLAGWMSVTKP